jgi:hypothetical protein
VRSFVVLQESEMATPEYQIQAGFLLLFFFYFQVLRRRLSLHLDARRVNQLQLPGEIWSSQVCVIALSDS